MKSARLVLLIFCLPAFAQTGPDIQVPQTFIAATAGAAISNGGSTGAANFRLTFRPTGFTAATVQVETAEDCAGVACATWTAIASANVIQGSNPIVWAATDSPPTSQTMAFVFTHPWYRVNVTHVTGVGMISTLLLGYRGAANGGFAKGGGGGGGCTPGGPTNAVQLNGGSGTCTGSSALEFDAANGAFTVGFPGVTLNLEGTPIPFGVVSHSNDQRIGISAGTHSDAGAVPLMDFHFSRGSDQAQTTVQNGDQLGFTAWLGYDGTAYYPAALSASYVCDNPTSGNIPGCWDLSTATTSSGLNTAIHIDDNQNVQIPVELSTQSGAIADFSLSGNTIPARTGTGAPTGSNCLAVGEQFFQTDATAGQNLWLATTFGTPCTWTQITSGSGSSGSGITVYASPALTLAAGTYYFPVGGGSLNSATESVAQTAAPAAMTVANFYVQISTALGSGNSAVFTWRKGSSSQTLTCTISGASATSCNDASHSFTTAAGNLIDIQAVLTGSVIASFAIVMTATTGNITPASPGFDTITTGTNTGQTLTVGAGSTMTASGGGQIIATSCPTCGGGGDTFSPPYVTPDGTNFYGPIFANTKPPTIASLSWINQGSATASSKNGAIQIECPTNSGDSLRALVKTSYPSTPFTFTIGVLPNMQGGQYGRAGIAISDGTKLVAWDLFNNNSQNVELSYWSNPTSFGGTQQTTLFGTTGPIYLTVKDDGTNFTLYVSTLGTDLTQIQVYQVSRTAFLTPSQIGIFVDNNNTSTALSALFFSWAGI